MKRAMAIRQELVRDEPKNNEFRSDVAWSYRSLGKLHQIAGRADFDRGGVAAGGGDA